MHNSQTTVTRFVPNLHVSPSADTEVPRLTSLAMLLHHLAKSSRIRGTLTKPFTIRHFSPSVLLTTPNYGVICRRLWYYQVFKVHFVTWCRGLTPSDRGCRILVAFVEFKKNSTRWDSVLLFIFCELLLFICYTSIIRHYTPKDTLF